MFETDSHMLSSNSFRDLATEPVPVRIDNMARLKYIVQSTLLHRAEVEATTPGAPPLQVTLRPREGGS